ncbi:MAG: 2-C-methyl-D-erythritol 2,4-cyclodiphosphate synthase [Gammaproteobacteria bacterium]|nr:2-C-methyl-D-erythritol 2,4-cyclodiphosphate synthase [Gammaproteobacteria bacterium]
MRIGQGFDAHAFADDAGDLIIGGVMIPYKRGLRAHSDGDVLLHALCDALLGAAGAGDIGQHFPDTDPAFSNVDSRELLRNVNDTIQQEGYRVHNLDLTIIAQAPKMAPYLETMSQHIANDLNIDSAQTNIKATTTEQMGFTGRKEGIAALAVVLLEENV